jgi:hypothetical protein
LCSFVGARLDCLVSCIVCELQWKVVCRSSWFRRFVCWLRVCEPICTQESSRVGGFDEGRGEY